ncbi:MAG: MBL fold metallo-hydrolase [Deltaproteobacteria bacterium]|nr:MBL fold metallo-hydrolase [Deltaproteobacteria bacterium]
MDETAGTLTVTMVRCSTLVLEWEGTRFLTDPWFAMHLRGLPCFRRPGCKATEVPALDAVLVSHLHPDHFDRAAMGRMEPTPQRVIFPPDALKALGKVEPGWGELALWESTSVGPVEIWAVPGPHTFPGPEEANFVLRLPDWGQVFFGGDARFEPDVIQAIADRFGPFRLALLPVGGTRIFGKRTVMAPEDAEKAADMLQAQTVIPIHEGGIWMSVPPLSLHPGRATHLVQALEERGEPNRVLVLQEGQTVTL